MTLYMMLSEQTKVVLLGSCLVKIQHHWPNAVNWRSDISFNEIRLLFSKSSSRRETINLSIEGAQRERERINSYDLTCGGHNIDLFAERILYPV